LYSDSDAKITVCIPVYDAGDFLIQTLDSVLNQTYKNIHIEIGVDPAKDDHTGKPNDSWLALKHFLHDKRVNVVQNSTQLGWDRNLNKILENVKTPFYAILPHDDIWHPRYLEILMGLMLKHPEVNVVYGDLHTWGKELEYTWRHAVYLPQTTNVREQLFFFLLQGAEAMPWRGLTRSKLLHKTRGFPVDEHRGFAVECEYALSLLLAGPVLHVPRTLYFKQFHHSKRVSASKSRMRERKPNELEAAWLNHKLRMKAKLEMGLDRMSQSVRKQRFNDSLLSTALTIAMLRQVPSIPLKSSVYKQEVKHAIQLLELLPSNNRHVKMLGAKLHFFLWQNAVASNDRIGAISHLKKAVSNNLQDADVCFAVASELEHAGSYIESLYWLGEANNLYPDRRGIAELRDKNYKNLNWFTENNIHLLNRQNLKILINLIYKKLS
jgi:glycosyltransferase involved in cell wall biosynthesis